MPILKSVAAEVIVWLQPALLSLLADFPGIDRVLPLHDGTPECDYDVDVELMELPHIFRTTLDTIPRSVPYVSVEPSVLHAEERMTVGVFPNSGSWDNRR